MEWQQWHGRPLPRRVRAASAGTRMASLKGWESAQWTSQWGWGLLAEQSVKQQAQREHSCMSLKEPNAPWACRRGGKPCSECEKSGHHLYRHLESSSPCHPKKHFCSWPRQLGLLSESPWDKEEVVYIYNGILLSHKKEWNNAICTNMDGPRDYHTKRSKSEREYKYHMIINFVWNLKYDTNELIYKTETDSQT